MDSSEFTSGPQAAAPEAALSGYLNKKTRDGRWQKRWFETNGVYLTYYKSKKMEKLLAALSLPQVGAINQIPQAQDPEGKEGLFALELNSRLYTLRAKNDDEAAQWVSVLLKLRQQGILAAQKEAEARGASGSAPGNPKAKLMVNGMEVSETGSDASSVDGSHAVWVKQGKLCGGCFPCC